MRVLRHPAFLAGADRHRLPRPAPRGASRRCCPPWTRVRLSCLAAALAGAAARQAAAALPGLPVRLAQRAVRRRSRSRTTVRPARIEVGYRLDRAATWRPGRARVDPEASAGRRRPPAGAPTTRRRGSCSATPVVLDVAGSGCVRRARVGGVLRGRCRGVGGADRAAPLSAAGRRAGRRFADRAAARRGRPGPASCPGSGSPPASCC